MKYVIALLCFVAAVGAAIEAMKALLIGAAWFLVGLLFWYWASESGAVRAHA